MKPCECRAVCKPTGSYIVFCPLHESAEEMRDALMSSLGLLDALVTINVDRHLPGFKRVEQRIRAAIAKALQPAKESQ